MTHDIVPSHLVVKAMRDNGYKNAAYALAELIDNSIQAGATKVKIVCIENNIARKYLSEIAVIDNGKGMGSDILRLSLQFGNGTHLDAKNQDGIGKFGMGLPNSSISQCKKLEVYSWQNNAPPLYSYLDLDDIASGKLTEIPMPEMRNIPDVYNEYISKEKGTLVLWTKIDRCMWQTAKSIFRHSEILIGRMYRYFIKDNRVEIKMIAKNDSGNISFFGTGKVFKVNDPLYLMENTSCPKPFDNSAMFNKWDGDEYRVPFTINYKNKEHKIDIKFTYAKEESRNVKKYGNAGDKPHGKHAQQNLGISIIRAEREIELDTKWTIQHDVTERWWGVEVSFPPSLDEVFGVTNNKQSARNFTADLANMDEGIYEGQTFIEYMDELKEENDPTFVLIEIAKRVDSTIKQIRSALKLQTKNTRKQRNNNSSAEEIATNATEELITEGAIGKSDQGENLSNDDKKVEISSGLEDAGIENSDNIAAQLVDDGLKYIIKDGDIDGDAFFSVRPKGGKIMIILNINHPVYPKLIEMLEKQEEDSGENNDTLDALKLLIMAWARYEDQQPDGEPKNRTQEARADWGRIAKRFLENRE